MKRICVYCASSDQCPPAYLEDAYRAGQLLAAASIEVIYGGGGTGLMGRLADGVLSAGGRIVGVMPSFMVELEWSHKRLSELHIVENMRERKHRMLLEADAVIAMPGGCGTFEEVLEAITLKRLGIFLGPIVFLNTRGFYDGLMDFMQHSIAENFMRPEHGRMWSIAATPEALLPTLRQSAPWSAEARKFATLGPLNN